MCFEVIFIYLFNVVLRLSSHMFVCSSHYVKSLLLLLLLLYTTTTTTTTTTNTG